MFNFAALSIFLVLVGFVVILIYKIARLKDKKDEQDSGGGGVIVDDEPNPNDNQTT